MPQRNFQKNNCENKTYTSKRLSIRMHETSSTVRLVSYNYRNRQKMEQAAFQAKPKKSQKVDMVHKINKNKSF